MLMKQNRVFWFQYHPFEDDSKAPMDFSRCGLHPFCHFFSLLCLYRTLGVKSEMCGNLVYSEAGFACTFPDFTGCL